MPETAHYRPLVSIAWMLTTGLCFVGVTAIVKHLGGRIPAAESAFLRYVLGLVFVIPLLPSMIKTTLPRKMLVLFGIRGLVQALGVILWFFAMSRITIAEVTAMNYMSPVYVTLGAALFLGERFAIRRLLAVAAALIGALIILRPGFRALDPGHLAMIFTALLFAASYLIAKRLTAVASPQVVVTMLSLTVPVWLAPFAAANWVTPTLIELGWLFVVAGLATFGHFAMTIAFKMAPMAVTQPVTFLQLVWAVLLGAVVFGEPADSWVVLGGVIIMAAVSFIAWREARMKSNGKVPLAQAG